MASGKVLVVAMTGASGALATREILRLLEADDRVERVHFIASESALRVLAEELQIGGRSELVGKLLGQESRKITHHVANDIGASIASGSYPTDGMVVLPCSMRTLAAIATGFADNLVARAADVALKERIPLLLCVRETPFNKIHLRNMQLAADAGATIFPMIPAFYNHPAGTEEMVHQYVCRLLAHVGLPQASAYRWNDKE